MLNVNALARTRSSGQNVGDRTQGRLHVDRVTKTARTRVFGPATISAHTFSVSYRFARNVELLWSFPSLTRRRRPTPIMVASDRHGHPTPRPLLSGCLSVVFTSSGRFTKHVQCASFTSFSGRYCTRAVTPTCCVRISVRRRYTVFCRLRSRRRRAVSLLMRYVFRDATCLTTPLCRRGWESRSLLHAFILYKE